MAKFDAHLKCSFCSKSQDQVRKLIAGPGVYICDECIDLCNEILDEELLESQAKTNISSPQVKKKLTNTQAETNDPLKINTIPKPIEIKGFLDKQVVGQESAKKNTKLPYIFLLPYQCSQSRNIESPRQGVRGSESFRAIRSSGIPYPF